MRVLILSHVFPPDPEVGSLRAAKVSEALVAAGHQVDVVTTRLAGEVQAVRTAGDGITVHTVRAIPHPRRAYLWAKRWFGRNGGPPVYRSEGVPAPTPAWKRYLLSLLWLPDEHQGFIPPAVWAAWDIHRRGGGVDLVYTTAPPFSAHLAGMIFKWISGVTWAAEFRDPWTDNPAKPARLRTRFTDAVERRLERLCLSKADRVVSATDSIHDLLASKITPSARQRFVVARNGIDRLTSPGRSRSVSGPLRIVHAGSLYHGRDPRPFLRSLAALRRTNTLAADDVRVEFVGDNRWFGEVSVEQLVRDLGLASIVEFHDWLPHDACLAVLERAHLLVVFAQHQPAQVPNKLFEYLGTRKPILAFADQGGEVARMLERVGGHYLVTRDEPSGVEAALAAALRDARAARAGETDETVLREWTTERQMQRLVLALQA